MEKLKLKENPRLTRRRIISEIRFECAMRLKVWRMADRKNQKFLKLEQQIRFDQMVFLGEMISAMTDQEWNHYCDRVEVNRKDKTVTTVRDLFTNNNNTNGRKEAS